jgi:hypothetical protein
MESISLPRRGVGTFWSMMTMILVDEWMVIFFGLTEEKKRGSGYWFFFMFYTSWGF